MSYLIHYQKPIQVLGRLHPRFWYTLTSWVIPYLGVIIASDLRWHTHISTISAKATRVLNFVRRNVYHCSPEAKSISPLSDPTWNLPQQHGTHTWLKMSCSLKGSSGELHASLVMIIALHPQQDWNSLPQAVRNKPSLLFFRNALVASTFFYLLSAMTPPAATGSCPLLAIHRNTEVRSALSEDFKVTVHVH